MRKVIAAAVLLVLATVVPPLITSRIMPIPLNSSHTYIAHGDHTTLTRQIDTSDPGIKDEVKVHVQDTLKNDAGKTLISVDDHLQLIRHSTYPVLDNNSSIAVTVLGKTDKRERFTRNGLQYFFPFNTERRSYDFYDVFAGDSAPLDYVRQDGDAYVYHQKREHVERTIWVEPKSGTILNEVEHLTLPGIDTTLEWDQATQDAARTHADRTKHTLQALRIASFMLKLCAVLLIAVALWRRR
ncbi:porin PorA family protein [Corynebacterium pelargi]|uniref:Uncharacterized protein n=1 Tax=Corynebacterium pelargi TaxID=1471400 RepID=A0A410W638_9CORY|nr:porin PorA family protein [Corynebacterium pelargi]QAU51511.1 hypothetical protein CPELA_01050 [Corynebacterium pelargi]GGG79681.1 hypothetical protein GCM10007338_17530 [Corynebacterium pelargi]